MFKPVVWSIAAEKDLEQILIYLNANWNVQVVNNFIYLVDKSIGQIVKHPNRYLVADETLNVRKCIVTKHNTLYFKEKEERIEILRLYDNRQNPKKLKFE